MSDFENERLVKSRGRIQQHGEVFTPDWIVQKMLNLLPSQGKSDVWIAPRIKNRLGKDQIGYEHSRRFLEPACGEGAFLVEVLRRKLERVWQLYGGENGLQCDFEWYSAVACSSVYGIEIMEDNAEQCTMNLMDVFNRYYERYEEKRQSEVRRVIQYLISRNIIQGNALTYRRSDGEPIVFSEWTPLLDEDNTRFFLRKDYTYEGLVRAKENALTLFAEEDPGLIKEYAPVPWLEVRYAE